MTTLLPDLIPVSLALVPSAKNWSLLEFAIHHPVRAHLLAVCVAVVVYIFYAPYRLYRETSSERDELRDRVTGANLRFMRTEVIGSPGDVRLCAYAENVGTGPMRNLVTTILTVNQLLDEPPAIDRFEHANEFSPASPFPSTLTLDDSNNDIPPKYIRFGYQYGPAPGQHTNTHEFLFRWGGITNGQVQAELNHVSIAEKDAVDQFVRQQLGPQQPPPIPHT